MSDPKKAWAVYAKITTGIFVGNVKANTKEEAEELGWASVATPSLCHVCARGLGDLEVEELEVFAEDEEVQQ